MEQSAGIPLEDKVRLLQHSLSGLDTHVGYLIQLKELETKIGSEPTVKELLSSAINATLNQDLSILR